MTRLKSLFYNPTFVIHISELKGQEAAHTLNFLREHLHAADDLTLRWKWVSAVEYSKQKQIVFLTDLQEPGSVAFWDNRVVAHRAIPGGYDPTTREGKRTAIYGEKPFFDPESESLSQRIARVGGDPAKNEIVNLFFKSPHV